MKLGTAISEARGKAGLSVTEMARQADYSIQHMSRVENGHSPPTAELMSRLAAVLGAPQLLVAYWKVRVEELSQEQKHARGALKEARAHASAGKKA